jgi:hypothetical protein
VNCKEVGEAFDALKVASIESFLGVCCVGNRGERALVRKRS